jgi:uncharacterized protein YkwD
MRGNKKSFWRILASVFLTSITLVSFMVLVAGVYFYGFITGYEIGIRNESSQVLDLMSKFSAKTPLSISRPTPTPQPVREESLPTWGGPELWEAVNKRRQELGVNPLSQRSELCTIASIRLNELLELGKLDAHEGFSNLPDRREDLKWIFERYDITEFLVAGASSAQEAVSLWENTLGHKKLLTGGEYVWGCIYAQAGFAVAITAF